MKPKFHLACLLLAFLMIGGSADAQILKKLKKRVQEATEDVIVEKAAEKTAQETGKAMDSLLSWFVRGFGLCHLFRHRCPFPLSWSPPVFWYSPKR